MATVDGGIPRPDFGAAFKLILWWLPPHATGRRTGAAGAMRRLRQDHQRHSNLDERWCDTSIQTGEMDWVCVSGQLPSTYV